MGGSSHAWYATDVESHSEQLGYPKEGVSPDSSFGWGIGSLFVVAIVWLDGLCVSLGSLPQPLLPRDIIYAACRLGSDPPG